MNGDDHNLTANTSTGHQPQQGLALQLSDLSRLLHADQDPSALLSRITAAAVQEVDGAQWAGITLIERRQLSTWGATHPVVEEVDRHQYALDEGPCLSSSRRARTVRAADLRQDKRWPRFSRATVDLGVLSMLCVQLFDNQRNLGALNLYSATPDAFDDRAETTAILLASHAALAIAGQRDLASMREALDVRDLVGQAKGILMERYRITTMEAFDLLAASSQNTNTKLTDVAQHLVDTRDLLLPS